MDAFLLKLTLSFIAGGLWITIATILAEKFGTKLGGIMAGIPSTIVISIFFIGWTQSTAAASESLGVAPTILAIAALFALSYVFFLRYSSRLAIPLALLVWFALSLSVVYFGFDDFAYGAFLSILMLFLSHYLFEKVLNVPSESQRPISYSPPQLLFRAIVSGTIISSAVLLAKLGGPILGGTFSAFPAVMLSTMIIAQKAHGPRYSAALLKTLTITAMLSVLVYIIAARYAYLYLDLVEATVLAFAASLAASYLIYLFAKKGIA